MRALYIAMLSIATAATLAAQAPAPQQVLIKAGRLIDGRSQQVQTNVGILIDGERIKAVGPLAQIQGQAANARVIDLGQMTVLPGLIDAHTHLLLQGDVTSQDYEDQLLKQSTPYRAILAARNARIALEHGFTAIRDLETEGAMYADVDVKLAVDRGEIPGPRIFASTRAMAPTGMYPITTANWELELPHGVQPVRTSVSPSRDPTSPTAARARVIRCATCASVAGGTIKAPGRRSANHSTILSMSAADG